MVPLSRTMCATPAYLGVECESYCSEGAQWTGLLWGPPAKVDGVLAMTICCCSTTDWSCLSPCGIVTVVDKE